MGPGGRLGVCGACKSVNDLPKDNKHRNEYIGKYKGMARAIRESQQPEGYWTRSMLDSAHAPGPETSGTAFFTYGMLWGINNGLLNEKEYLPVVQKSWQYLTSSGLAAGLVKLAMFSRLVKERFRDRW